MFTLSSCVQPEAAGRNQSENKMSVVCRIVNMKHVSLKVSKRWITMQYMQFY